MKTRYWWICVATLAVLAVPGGSAQSANFVSRSPAGTADRAPLTAYGTDWHAGVNGVGFDFASALNSRLSLRTGLDFFRYSRQFSESGVPVDANVHLQSAHVDLDWYPRGGRFHVGPRMVFLNNNSIAAESTVPSGSTLTLDGQDFVGSQTDPLHGSGKISFGPIAPGMTIGFGNLASKKKGHWKVPVEAGFYYVGQPRLEVNFTGQACSPDDPSACEDVSQDQDFQTSLAKFIARQNHNLSYAKFFPILSVGVGYAF
ncbi:MAG TPA: hypothetical protein VN734_16005 [Acidobacteriaceae bacterium]|nr:hypothetical protein [Acidobacteriaceae bacterium]